MYVQVVTFHLAGLSEADYIGACNELAPAIADVPGLVGKTFIANREANTYGGVYMWRDRQYGPIGVPLGFTPLPGGPFHIDETAYHPIVLEFGPGSVDGWLAWLVASELGIGEEKLLDVENRQLVLDGDRIDLTPLEFGVLRQLVDHQGRTVTRRALLEEVWGCDHAVADSNVIEAVVRSVRRKLGERAGMIETVRGLGYRLRAG